MRWSSHRASPTAPPSAGEGDFWDLNTVARLVFGRLADTRVALAQLDARLLRCVHKLLAGAVKQPAVGGVRDGLGLRITLSGVFPGGLELLAAYGVRLVFGVRAVDPAFDPLDNPMLYIHPIRRLAGAEDLVAAARVQHHLGRRTFRAPQLDE